MIAARLTGLARYPGHAHVMLLPERQQLAFAERAPIRRVVYSAAHGGFAGQPVPLGGGATIANWLTAEWARTRPFELELITPAILGAGAPTARDVVRFSEREYGDFCDRFERAATARILEEDPRTTSVLVNDIAEAPDFHRLAAAGFHIVTIYHVDVIAYVAAIYLRGVLAPERLVRLHARSGGWWPRILQLIFAKQRASVECSASVVVPSAGMREVLRRSYGQAPVSVVPWGAQPVPYTDAEIEVAAAGLRTRYGIWPGTPVLLTLSRLSPEKGHDILLNELRRFPRRAVLIICGEPAFMRGERYTRKLHRLATKLNPVKVIFAGYATGLEKAAFFRLADVYVFPSRHESYGLTLMEAIEAGCRVVSLDHLGAREIVRPEYGEVVTPGELNSSLIRQSALPRRPRGEAQPRFDQAAQRLASLLTEPGQASGS